MRHKCHAHAHHKADLTVLVKELDAVSLIKQLFEQNEMQTPGVGTAGILLDIKGKLTMIKFCHPSCHKALWIFVYIDLNMNRIRRFHGQFYF